MSRHRKSDPKWRGEASAEVMAACVPDLGLGPGAAVLVAGEASPVLLTALEQAGCASSLWLRRAGSSLAAVARTWPADGPFAAALLRLPSAKEELDMMLHAAAARVAPGGAILVYGANDEGIRSVATRMEPLLGAIETIGQRAHCRVLLARRPQDVPGARARLADWRQSGQLEIAGTDRAWVSYPGTFAKGGLDAGTRLLLAALAPGAPSPPGQLPLAVSKDARILDFGCGTGVIAAHLRARWPDARIEMTDWDALAALAASENVPSAAAYAAAGLKDLDAAKYDLIVSNPPIHDGKAEDYTVLTRLIAEAPEKLGPKGALVLVVLGRVPVEEWLGAAFDKVETIAQDARYRVWCARGPKVKDRPRGRKAE